MAKVTMMNKHTPLAIIELESGHITKVYEQIDTDLMPVVFSENPTASNMDKWMQKRRIPENREGLKDARMAFSGFDKCKRYFSLTDQYWFCYKKEKWEDHNFFTNDYNEKIGTALFTPWAVKRGDLKGDSPDYTTNGVVTKCWKKEDGISKLYKAGSERYRQEPLSEVMASVTLDNLGLLDHVTYRFAVTGMRLCSVCDNFVTEDTEFVPASHIFHPEKKNPKTDEFRHLILMANEYGITGMEEYLYKLIVIDKVICNPDRHLGNFGFLRNVETGEFIGFAPVFDCSSAYYGKRDDVKGPRSVFSAHEKEALRRIHIDEKIKKTRTIREILKKYPCITEKKKEIIEQNIDMMVFDLTQRKDKSRSYYRN